MTGNGTGSVVVSLQEDEVVAVPVGDVFVSIDLGSDLAYVACEGDASIRWKEVSRTDGELLVTMGARAEIQLAS